MARVDSMQGPAESWKAYRHNGGEGPSASRALAHTMCSLRLGLGCHFLAIVGLCASYAAAGGNGLFSYTLNNAGDHIITCSTFRTLAVVFTFLYLIGTVCVSGFQIIMADDASWSRGFRAGSKVISYATLFDICSGVLQFVLFFHLLANDNPAVWGQFSNGGAEWLLTTFARLLHAISCILYAQGFFLVEAYHENGTSGILAIALFVTYFVSGVTEILGFAFVDPALAPVVGGITSCLGLLWALAFERQLNEKAPRLHEVELSNQIEEKVNYYARMAPVLFSSDNTMTSFDSRGSTRA